MTAEIAILNKTAVALAADSKVTLSMAGKQKTYDTVDKLFSLSKAEPVGAMIYGNAEFMDFPWETILKEYRRRNPRKCFDTVFDWADDLKNFLLTFFPFTEDDEGRAALGIAQSWTQRVVGVCFPRATSQQSFRDNVVAEISQLTEDWKAADDFMTLEEWAALSARIAKGLSHIADKVPFSDQEKALKSAIAQLCEVAIRKAVPSPSASGLVVAGFGDRELLPSLIAFEIDGIIFKRLKIIENQKFDTTRVDKGMIVPFAQTDMVYRFMEGIDPDYAVQLHESIGDLLLRSSIETATALRHGRRKIAQLMPALNAATAAAVKAFWNANERVRRERFVSPIIDMTMSLPKDELANLAESLVSLTSLQRKVSREMETVGGAIDVAVISKGDGFVWIKRKHYFSPDRNLRFVNGYFSEFGHNGGNGDANNATA